MAIAALNNALTRCAQVLETTLTGIGSREELYRAGEHILVLLKTYAPAYYPGKNDLLLKSIRAVNDAIVVIWLLQYIPYFGQAKDKDYVKTKIALFGDGPNFNPNALMIMDYLDDEGRPVKDSDGKNKKEFAPGVNFKVYEDTNRAGRTAFQYDLKFRPLRAVTHFSFLLACIHSTAELFVSLCVPVAARMGVFKFFGEVAAKNLMFAWRKASSLLLLVAYGAWTAESIRYLANLKNDLSRSPEKESLKLGIRSSLTVYNGIKLFGVTHKITLAAFAIFAGILGIITINLVKFRKDAKIEARRDIISAAKTANPNLPALPAAAV
jgi:hypothetical protein